MQKDPFSIIIRPLITEKGEEDTGERNAYHFEVSSDANKIEVKRAIEKIYEHKEVKVKKVRIINKKSKERRIFLTSSCN